MNAAAALLSTTLVASAGLAPPALPHDERDAEPGPIYDLGIAWRGQECGDRAQVYERLHALAPGLSLAPADQPAAVTIDAAITQEPGGAWSVGLAIDSPSGVEQRTFTAESCAVAIEATALVLAVAVDPVAVADTLEQRPEPAPSEVEPEPEPEPPQPSPTQLPPSSVSPPSSEAGLILNLPTEDTARPPPERPAPRLGLALLGGGGYGPLATGAAELGLRVAVVGHSWRVEARGLWRPSLRQPTGDGFLRVDGGLGGLRGCGVLRAAMLEFPLCAGLEAGAIRARAGDGIANPSRATQPYVGVALGPGLAWAPIDRLALGVGLEAMVPLVFGGFALDGQTALSNLPIGVRALASVEVRLP